MWVVLLVATITACSPPQPLPTSTDGLRVVAVIAERPGYERSCRRGSACVFGPAWSDAVTTGNGRNGCDQRSDVLRDQLTDVQLRAGTHGCVVESGTLDDPYTGTRVGYRRGDPAQPVAVDHV